jgi:hypothetical protein
MFNQTRPLMLEVYDRERTAALLKTAREITAGLKSEMGEIALQMSRVLDGREEDADGIDALESDPQERGRPQLTFPATTSQQCPTRRKSFWQFWR